MSIAPVWEKMLEGNRRYAAGLQSRADVCAKRRSDTAADQHPCAAVVACSDSRVPVEHLFDMGVGDLFVVRVAGNVVGRHEAGSLEHAVVKLHVPLVLVLGHTGCEAVSAALSGDGMDGAFGQLIKKILPAADRAKAQNPGKSGIGLFKAACVENVYQAISDLYKRSSAVKDAAANGKVTVTGALYDIETGEITALEV